MSPWRPFARLVCEAAGGAATWPGPQGQAARRHGRGPGCAPRAPHGQPAPSGRRRAPWPLRTARRRDRSFDGEGRHCPGTCIDSGRWQGGRPGRRAGLEGEVNAAVLCDRSSARTRLRGSCRRAAGAATSAGAGAYATATGALGVGQGAAGAPAGGQTCQAALRLRGCAGCRCRGGSGCRSCAFCGGGEDCFPEGAARRPAPPKPRPSLPFRLRSWRGRLGPIHLGP